MSDCEFVVQMTKDGHRTPAYLYRFDQCASGHACYGFSTGYYRALRMDEERAGVVVSALAEQQADSSIHYEVVPTVS